jgi:predicted hotdog family 3-hydroxylacyl-ACP dehydratase
MILIDAIVDEVPGGVVCRATIGPDSLFVRDGAASSVVCVELVAQSVAAFVGLTDRREGGEPRGGLLVGCRDAQFHVEHLSVGDDLRVSVRRQWIREPAASFAGAVKRGTELVATVELTVVSGESVASLLAGEVPL